MCGAGGAQICLLANKMMWQDQLNESLYIGLLIDVGQVWPLSDVVTF